MSVQKKTNRITTDTIRRRKANGEKIAMLTAYDFTSAKIVDSSGIDIILVGDSAANVMAGYETTLAITLEHMIYHAQCVTRGVNRALVVVDLPFGTYQSDPQKALESAIRIMKESGAQAVKLEGGDEIKEAVKRITKAGIPVMGHLGLMPQSIHQYGSYGLRCQKEEEAEKLIRDAQLLEDLGCFAVVLEKISAKLAKRLSESISIPSIGIGAGKYCDGQVLVYHDMLGMNEDFNPKFLRRYSNLREEITRAVSSYIKDVRENHFPTEQESY